MRQVAIKVLRMANHANNPIAQRKYARASINGFLSPVLGLVLIGPKPTGFGEGMSCLGTSSSSKCASFFWPDWRPSDPFHGYSCSALHFRRSPRLPLSLGRSTCQQTCHCEGPLEAMNFNLSATFFWGERNCERPYIRAWEKGGSWRFDDGKENICFHDWQKKIWSCTEQDNVLIEFINGNFTPLISDFGRSRVLETEAESIWYPSQSLPRAAHRSGRLCFGVQSLY